MKHAFALAAILLGLASAAPAQEKPKVLVEGLEHPNGLAVGPGGKIYVTVAGNPEKQIDGAVILIENGKAVQFASNIGRPTAITAYQQWLFVATKNEVWRIDAKGKAEKFVRTEDFPTDEKNLSLVGITADPESGTLYACNLNDQAIYRIAPNKKVSMAIDKRSFPANNLPMAVLLDGQSQLLIGIFSDGAVVRFNLFDLKSEKLADGLRGGLGMAWDFYGRLFIRNSNFAKGGNPEPVGRILAIPRPGENAIPFADGFSRPSAMCLDANGKGLLVTDSKAGTLSSIPISIPGWEVDETPLPLQTALAFPNLEWTGWKGETAKGQANPLRPMVLTHAGDGSNRVFVATEHGVIHVFNNDQKPQKTSIFLDIQDRVVYRDDQNEEGFLGLAFHPKHKENGEFFVFYTTKKAKMTNVLSRFKVSKDDPNKADPNSEEELMRFEKPFWNHDGGTLCFGPDGYLYLTHGDGGAANDPFDNGQNLKSLLGKVHRIDVDFKPDEKSDNGKKPRNYGIPKDNPFVGRTDGSRPEIWAYGLRNIWRMSFDRKTGQLWAGDVGQNLYEEIDLIEKGGNYGWNRREGLHPFGPKGRGYSKEFIDPIWEYHHDVGKCIIGGHVYRGPRLPELDGYYLYGDYVSNKIWALRYDEAKKRVVANRPIKDRNLPMFSFGEDEKGEVYMLTPSVDGKSVWWFAK
jgi:glucose/arabinose dehydrogenase